MAPTSPDSAPAPPTQIGRYRIVARLGGGGMADVYLGVASGLVGFTKLSVVKVVKREIASEPEHVQLFLDEARISARLNHPNVVQTNEVGEDQGTYYLVMEYLEGQTLRRAMKVGNASEGERTTPIFLRALCEVLAGLHYAHELADYDGRPFDVVHRDVSPHNIFVTYEGSVKLVDFGIAKAAGALHLTGAGVLRGKFAYMAPEQARGHAVDRRSDIYSAGVILWEMLARRRMWNNEHELTILHRLSSGALPSLREHAPNVPLALIEVCERALCLDPAGRFQTAHEMRTAIEAELVARGWHATASDVGVLVSERFRDERADFRRCIEDAFSANSVQTLSPASMSSLRALPALPVTGTPSVPSLRALQAHTPSVPSLRALHSSDPPSSPTSVTARSLSSTNSTTASALTSTIPPPWRSTPESTALPPNALSPTGLSVPPPSERQRASLLAWAMPFVAGALLAGASFYLLRESPAIGRSANTAASARAPEAPRPPPASPSGSALIELRIKASPPAAAIFLDGQPLEGNPFRGIFPRGGKHVLRVEAKGHEAATQTLAFEQDVTEASVSLARLSPTPSTPSARPHKSPNGTHADAPEDPGGKRRRPPRPIDSELPY